MEIKGKNEIESTPEIKFSDEQIEIFARRIMPEIKKYFADDNVKKDFQEWLKNKKNIAETYLLLVISGWAIDYELSIALLFFLN